MEKKSELFWVNYCFNVLSWTLFWVCVIKDSCPLITGQNIEKSFEYLIEVLVLLNQNTMYGFMMRKM